MASSENKFNRKKELTLHEKTISSAKQAALYTNVIKSFKMWYELKMSNDNAIHCFIRQFQRCSKGVNLRQLLYFTTAEQAYSYFKEECSKEKTINYDELLSWFEEYSKRIYIK